MAEFCLKCFNRFNYKDYKRYEVIEEWGLCEGCAAYKNVVVDIRGNSPIDIFMKAYNKLFPKPEAEEIKVDYNENLREINDYYLCELGACNRELVDGVPPCADCKFCVSKEDAYLDF